MPETQGRHGYPVRFVPVRSPSVVKGRPDCWIMGEQDLDGRIRRTWGLDGKWERGIGWTSTETDAILEAAKLNAEAKCSECDRPREQDHRTHGHAIPRKDLCFACNFWMDHMEYDRQGGPGIVVEGIHYRYHKMENREAHRIGLGTGNTLGFGGEHFYIRQWSGFSQKEIDLARQYGSVPIEKFVESNNVWCQGEVPPHFRDRLPDNAEFLSRPTLENPFRPGVRTGRVPRETAHYDLGGES